MKENKEKREFARQFAYAGGKKQLRPGLYSYRYRPERKRRQRRRRYTGHNSRRRYRRASNKGFSEFLYQRTNRAVCCRSYGIGSFEEVKLAS